MEKNKTNKNEVSPQAPPEASDLQTNKIQTEYISINKIVPHPIFDTGIRNEEKFKELIEDIKLHGQNQNILIRPIGDNKFELGIGHHRWRAYLELNKNEKGYDKIKAEIRHIDDDAEWGEIIVTDNLKRTDYSQMQLENQTYFLWEGGCKSGRYENHEDLGKAMGCTDTWIRNRIEARELRIKVKEKYPEVTCDNISTQSMIDAKKIMENRGEFGFKDYAALLDLANKKEYKSGRIKEIAETLPLWTEDLRNKVLFEGASYGSIKFDLKNKANGNKPKPKNKTPSKSIVETTNPKFIIEIYEALNKEIHTYLTAITDKEKEKAIRYIKMTIVLLCEELLNHNRITEVHFKQISDETLGVKISPYNYDGGSDLQRLGEFINSHAENLEQKFMERWNK